MKKLADITKKNGEIIFTEKNMRLGDYMLPLLQDIFQEMVIKKEDKGYLVYMSKEDFDEYQQYKKQKDDDWDLK